MGTKTVVLIILVVILAAVVVFYRPSAKAEAPFSARLALATGTHSSPEAPTSDGGVKVVDNRSDPPEFERVYSAAVGDGFVVTIRMKTYMGHRMDFSEVTQRGGRWITFDARAVADKIIDRELLPLVQATTNRILAMDAEYMKSDPSEYTDTKGAKWRRQ